MSTTAESKIVTGVRLWNLNEPGAPPRGWKEVTIFVGDTPSESAAAASGLVPTAPGAASPIDYSTRIAVPFVKGRYVRLQAKSLWPADTPSGCFFAQIRLQIISNADAEQSHPAASEIFAGAIRDHRRGKIVGQKSYGKGSVQGIFPLTTTNASVRLTTAKFFSPNGQAISKVGVALDIRVPLDPKPHLVAKPAGETSTPIKTTPPTDTVLNEGLKHARNQLSQRHP